MVDFLKVARALNPHIAYRQGKKSAEEVLLKNRVTSKETIESILSKSISFREFQQLGSFHKFGYYENMGEYSEGMPMLPQMFSPLFGKIIGEYAFAGYVEATHPNVPTPSFLSCSGI